jgi:hypothetical protein
VEISFACFVFDVLELFPDGEKLMEDDVENVGNPDLVFGGLNGVQIGLIMVWFMKESTQDKGGVGVCFRKLGVDSNVIRQHYKHEFLGFGEMFFQVLNKLNAFSVVLD